MTETDEVEVEAVVATGHPIAAYGGIRLSEAALQNVADELQAGGIPMVFGHDLRRAMNARLLEVSLRHGEEGYPEVWVRFRISSELWGEYEREQTAAGAPGGFSIGFSEPLVTLDAADVTTGSDASFTIAADAFHWGDAEVIDAATTLSQVGNVEVRRRYELALAPAAVVVVVITLIVLPVITSVIAAALYDALKQLMKPEPENRSIFHFHVVNPEGYEATGRLETSDNDVLLHAIDALQQVVGNPSALSEWDEDSSTWQSGGTQDAIEVERSLGPDEESPT